MGLFGKLFDKPVSATRPQSLDEDARRLLLSAAGNVGGYICDVLLEYAQSEEERFFIAVETGFFGVGVAAHFFVIRYSKAASVSDFATSLLDSYRVAYIDFHNQSTTTEERSALDQFLQREGPPAVGRYIGALSTSVRNPEAGLDKVLDVLTSRLRERGGVVLPDQTPPLLRNKIEVAILALMDSYEHFRG